MNAKTAEIFFDNNIRISGVLWIAASPSGFSYDDWMDVLRDASDAEDYMHESMKVFRGLPEFCLDDGEEIMAELFNRNLHGFIVTLETPKPTKFYEDGFQSLSWGFTMGTHIYVEEMKDATSIAVAWREARLLELRKQAEK